MDFEANKTEKGRKVPEFLSMLGSIMCYMVLLLLAPAKPKDKKLVMYM